MDDNRITDIDYLNRRLHDAENDIEDLKKQLTAAGNKRCAQLTSDNSSNVLSRICYSNFSSDILSRDELVGMKLLDEDMNVVEGLDVRIHVHGGVERLRTEGDDDYIGDERWRLHRKDLFDVYVELVSNSHRNCVPILAHLIGESKEDTVSDLYMAIDSVCVGIDVIMRHERSISSNQEFCIETHNNNVENMVADILREKQSASSLLPFDSKRIQLLQLDRRSINSNSKNQQLREAMPLRFDSDAVPSCMRSKQLLIPSVPAHPLIAKASVNFNIDNSDDHNSGDNNECFLRVVLWVEDVTGVARRLLTRVSGPILLLRSISAEGDESIVTPFPHLAAESSSHYANGELEQDFSSGLCYNRKTGYYFDPKSQLHYDASTLCYYSFDHTTSSYTFYSCVTGQLPTTLLLVPADMSTTPVLPRNSLFSINRCGAIIGPMLDSAGTSDAYSISLPTPHVFVSSRLAEVAVGSDNRFYIRDCSITNITNEALTVEPVALKHGDSISISGVSLIVHLHVNGRTCRGCEAAVVASKKVNSMPTKNNNIEAIGSVSSGREVLEKQRRAELLRLKRKFDVVDYVGPVSDVPDRAFHRRQREATNRNQCDPIIKSVQSASVLTPISTENKGRLLLEKMGWTSGHGLGRDESGITEAPEASWRGESRAGLGVPGVSHSLAVAGDEEMIRRHDVFLKTQKRFVDKKNTI